MGIGGSWSQSFLFPLSFNASVNVQRVTQTEPNEAGQLRTRKIEYAPEWSSIFSANYRWKKPKITLAYTLCITGRMALPKGIDEAPRKNSPRETSPFIAAASWLSMQNWPNFAIPSRNPHTVRHCRPTAHLF